MNIDPTNANNINFLFNQNQIKIEEESLKMIQSFFGSDRFDPIEYYGFIKPKTVRYCYFQDINKDQAEEILLKERHHGYSQHRNCLIRRGPEGGLVISYVSEDRQKCKHLLCKPTPDGKFTFNQKSFSTAYELVKAVSHFLDQTENIELYPIINREKYLKDEKEFEEFYTNSLKREELYEKQKEETTQAKQIEASLKPKPSDEKSIEMKDKRIKSFFEASSAFDHLNDFGVAIKPKTVNRCYFPNIDEKEAEEILLKRRKGGYSHHRNALIRNGVDGGLVISHTSADEQTCQNWLCKPTSDGKFVFGEKTFSSAYELVKAISQFLEKKEHIALYPIINPAIFK